MAQSPLVLDLLHVFRYNDEEDTTSTAIDVIDSSVMELNSGGWRQPSLDSPCNTSPVVTTQLDLSSNCSSVELDVDPFSLMMDSPSDSSPVEPLDSLSNCSEEPALELDPKETPEIESHFEHSSVNLRYYLYN